MKDELWAVRSKCTLSWRVAYVEGSSVRKVVLQTAFSSASRALVAFPPHVSPPSDPLASQISRNLRGEGSRALRPDAEPLEEEAHSLHAISPRAVQLSHVDAPKTALADLL